jgi:hypothetical protein
MYGISFADKMPMKVTQHKLIIIVDEAKIPIGKNYRIQ